MPVDDTAFSANQNGAFDHVFEFPDVAGPMIAEQHVNRRRRDAPDAVLVDLGKLLEKVVGQQ